MKTTRQALTLALSLAMILVACSAIPAFAADNDLFAPGRPNVYVDDSDSFVPGEVLAPADSLRHAREIAAAYGLVLKSYAYGIAVLAATDAKEAVAQSNSISANMDGGAENSARGAVIPNLSLNMLCQTYEVVNNYSHETAFSSEGAKQKYTRTALPYEHDNYAITRAAELMPAHMPEHIPGLMPAPSSTPHNFYQWHHLAMESERAWSISTGKNVVVAVIDTGIDINHPDFAGRISAKSYNSHTRQIGMAYVQDDHYLSHGTHVSGIIAAAQNYDIGVCGVAPGAQIMAIKANIPTNTSYFDMASVLRGINYAVDNGANIINMSFGYHYSAGPNELDRSVIAAAVAKGVTVVCAAGNDNYSHAGYPAAYEEVIAVSAIKWGYQFEYAYSNYGPEIDLAAPGSSIYSTTVGGYAVLSGTSMASPHVAGAAALVKAQNPGYTPQQVREALRQTSRDAGDLGRDDYFGYGIVNAYSAVLGPAALYNVTFDFNDGLRAPISVKAAPGNTVLPPYSPQLRGYAFAGWYIAGSGVAFDFASAINGNVNLYAQWVEIKSGMYIAEFSDANFRRAVLQLLNMYGLYRADGSFVANDLDLLASIVYLDVGGLGISDMAGLRYFSALKILWCPGNSLTALDVSANTALVELYCHYNKLKTLNAANNPALEQLICYVNELEALNITNCKNIWELHCSENQLRVLDVSNIAALEVLGCYSNQLSTLDVSNNTMLRQLISAHNPLGAIDVSKNPRLTHLWCYDNQLSALDISNNTALEALLCDGNLIKSLDISKNIKLRELWCQYNQLSALDVSTNTELEVLLCNKNQLNSLDVAKNSAIYKIWCNENQLNTLNVSQNTALEMLICYDNNLIALNVSKNTALWYLDCHDNYLPSTNAVIGWQALDLVLGDTFCFHPQKSGSITFAGSILYQPSPVPATVLLYDSAGNFLCSVATDANGYYKPTISTTPTGAGYTLVVTKPGYLSYTVKNLTLSDGLDMGTIDIRQLAGDVNGDGIVNAVDLTCLLSEFNQKPLSFANADIDGNGIVNAADLTYLLAGFNKRTVIVGD